MSFNNQDRSSPVGGAFMSASPIYRPMVRRCAPQADKSAMCTINDSVGKFCKHVRTSPFSERRTEHYEKNLHMQRNEQQSLLLPRVSCSCSSHAEDEYAASRAAKAGSCLVPALVSLSVQIFPTESFIAHTADVSALSVDVMESAFKNQSA